MLGVKIIKGFELGFSFSTFNISYVGNSKILNSKTSDINISASSPYGIVHFGKPLMPLELFVQKAFSFNKFNFTAALSGGMLVTPKKADLKAQDRLTAGLNIGVTYFIMPRLGLNASLGTEYLHFGMHEVYYNIWTFSESVGIRYRF